MISAESDPSIRTRILAATYTVISTSGPNRLQLQHVAAEAGVSRQTVYRYFGSKDELLSAFALYEQDNFRAAMAAATAGLRGDDRLDAALNFIVDYQFSHSHAPLVASESDYSIAQMARVIPVMEKGMRSLITGEHAEIVAAAVVRIAVCHYLVRGQDRNKFLAELRYTAGLDPRRKRAARH